MIKHERAKDKNNAVSGVTDVEYEARVRNKMMALSFLVRSDMKRYRELMNDIKDQYIFGKDVYPTSLEHAYIMLENWAARATPKGGNKNGNNNNNRTTQGHSGGVNDSQNDQQVTGLQYAQQVNVVPGNDGRAFEEVKCYRCNKMGHYAGNCPGGNEQIEGGIQQHMTGSEIHDGIGHRRQR